MGDNSSLPWEITMKKYARTINGIVTTSIQLGEVELIYELKNIHYFKVPSFHVLPNEDSLPFIRDLYSTIQTFPLYILTKD